MQVFLDESGDLGWKFDKQFREGGSSRYLTLAFMFLPFEQREKPKQIIRDLYNRFKWSSEKKAAKATPNQKNLFCEKAAELLSGNTDIKIDVITAMKQNVSEHIRLDPNKLYNYMAGLVLPEYIQNVGEVEFIPDERTVKVRSGNSLVDYLQTKMWFELNSSTVIKNNPGRSHQQYNLQFVDWIAHCMWIKYENRITEPYDTITPHINHRSDEGNNSVLTLLRTGIQ